MLYTTALSAPLGGPDTHWLAWWLNVSEGPGKVEFCACRNGVYGWLTLVTSKPVHLKSELQHTGTWLVAAWPLPKVYACNFFPSPSHCPSITHRKNSARVSQMLWQVLQICYLVKKLRRFETAYVEACQYGMPISEFDCHIPEEWIPQRHRCQGPKFVILW